MRSSLLSTLALCALSASAAPTGTPAAGDHEKRILGFGPTVDISSPQATIKGRKLPFVCHGGGFIDSFKGIPFAQAPVGSLRLRPPQPLTGSLGDVDARTLLPPSCPQFIVGSDLDIANFPGLAKDVLEAVVATPLVANKILKGQEDCLTLNVQRPAGTEPGAKLPVVLWIFGGGFELGGTALYDGTNVVAKSMQLGKPVVFVEMNYRVGGFGFLAGKEVLADGSANLGLLDQRMAMQWVADNIDAFGGDPDKVTLWGESAGAISIFDQYMLNNGDVNYKGKPLFRGAIMNSGSAAPTDKVDCPKAQAVYDKVVQEAGCGGRSDTLGCLRTVDYETLLKATKSVPGFLSYNSIDLSYMPRPDGTTLPVSAEVFAASDRMPAIPYILGDQKDEGTIFALFQSNLTTTAAVEDYLHKHFFTRASPDLVSRLVASYPDDPSAGSPFDTGAANNWYPQYKRLAALLGDAVFTLTRRLVLNTTTAARPGVARYSYLSDYDSGVPVLGTFHASDLVQVFFGVKDNYAANTILNYFINFAYGLDPNGGGLPQWPQWSEAGNRIMNFHAGSAELIADDFRRESYEILYGNAGSFHL